MGGARATWVSLETQHARSNKTPEGVSTSAYKARQRAPYKAILLTMLIVAHHEHSQIKMYKSTSPLTSADANWLSCPTERMAGPLPHDDIEAKQTQALRPPTNGVSTISDMRLVDKPALTRGRLKLRQFKYLQSANGLQCVHCAFAERRCWDASCFPRIFSLQTW